MGFACIQLRNLVTFFAQTWVTLKQSKDRDEQDQYHSEFLSKKLEYMTLDVVMQHERTYPYFQNFIEKYAKDYQVYLNVCLMIKIYQSETDKLGSIDQMLQVNETTSQNTMALKKRTASRIKKEMEKIPKLRKNKEQLEGDQEQL